MGGYIALNFYNRYPERVEALVLSNTQAAGDSNEAKDKRFANIQKIQREGLTEFADSFSKSVLCVKTLNSNPHLQKKIEAMILQQKPHNLALVLGAIAMRKRPQWHKRLVLIATVVMLWPAWFRWRHFLPWVPRPDITLGLIVADLPIVVAMVRDRLRFGAVHPAYWWVGLPVICEQTFEALAFGTPFWTRFGMWLYGLLG